MAKGIIFHFVHVRWTKFVEIQIRCSCEVVGKHPNTDEANTYDIVNNVPVFMSVRREPDLTDDYARYLKKCSNYFRNNYS